MALVLLRAFIFYIGTRMTSDTVASDSEITVASNVVLVSRTLDGVWRPFSWEDYIARSPHRVLLIEKNFLGSLVIKGLLNYIDRQYYVTDLFMNVFFEVIAAPPRLHD